MGRKNNILFYLYAFVLILSMYGSLNLWILWEINDVYFEFVLLLVSIAYIIPQASNNKSGGQYRVLIYVCVAVVSALNLRLRLSYPFYLKPAFFLALLLSGDDKRRLLKIWTVSYSLILVISLVGWFLIPFNLLPSYGVISPSWITDYSHYIYQNYGICLLHIGITADIMRFNSVFLEPGHVAMLGAFTVYANKYDCKNIWVLGVLICSILTFSLAGYILLVIGYILTVFQMSSGSKIIRRTVFLGLFLYIFVSFFQNYNNGDNVINTLILQRLEPDEEKGISGNNRFWSDTNDRFDQFIVSSHALTGYSADEYEKGVDDSSIRGAGYKIFMMQKGIVGTCLIFIAYLLMACQSSNRKFMLCMLVLYSFAFIQRAYPLWNCWLYLYLFCSDFNVKESQSPSNF